MCEKSDNVQTEATGQLNEPGRPLFSAYGQHDPSPVLAWLPIVLGLIASAIVALAYCPVPRSATVSAAQALFLALVYVFATVGIGAAVLSASGMIVAKDKREAPIRGILPLFCSVAAGMAPVAAFYARDSLWAVSAALVLSILVSRLIYRYDLASRMAEIFASSAESRTDRPQSTRLISLSLAALVLEFGVLSTAASMARPATVLISCAIIVISFFYQSVNQSPLKSRFPKGLPSSITLGFAIILVAASLTPYLEVSTEDANDMDATASRGHSMLKPGRRSAKTTLLQSTASWFRRFPASNPQPGTHGKRAGGGSADRPYPALQALFGEGNTASGSESNPGKKELNSRKSTALVAGASEPGVILRPKVTDHVTIVPPPPMRRVFDAKPSLRTTNPVSIPFYGAYWIFKTSDKTLPPGAIDARGDPDSIVFKTTDFSPISMEARQNFGSPIQLSCCGAIELVISNADRRPGTVRVELILTNTTLPGQPGQSLGVLPVNSTLHWFPGDDRPPVTEVLSFRLPAQPAIQSFDEATIRFEMQSPRERWSAKIAVKKFRLIPRVF
jgi:hypothetical protein